MLTWLAELNFLSFLSCRLAWAPRESLFFFFFGHRGLWNLSSLTRAEPVPPEVEARSLIHWATREVPPREILVGDVQGRGKEQLRCGVTYFLALLSGVRPRALLETASPSPGSSASPNPAPGVGV